MSKREIEGVWYIGDWAIKRIFVRVYEERFERQYGFYRSYLHKVIYRYLDRSDLHNVFTLMKCSKLISSEIFGN